MKSPNIEYSEEIRASIERRNEDRAKFMKKVAHASSGCWEWGGYRQDERRGYGQLRHNGKGWLAHRLSFILFRGPIPSGMLVCHHCDNKGCVNPSHLYLATNQVNIQDAWKRGLGANQNTRKTCCSNCGGPFTPTINGWRHCVPCKKASNRRTSKVKRAADRALRAAIDAAMQTNPEP